MKWICAQLFPLKLWPPRYIGISTLAAVQPYGSGSDSVSSNARHRAQAPAAPLARLIFVCAAVMDRDSNTHVNITHVWQDNESVKTKTLLTINGSIHSKI